MKTTAFLAALAAFLLAAPSVSFAQASGSFSFGAPKAANPADFVTVEAKGQGESVEAAKKDAVRNAIKIAVGELVDAKTLVENDELVEDKILTLSNAMVEKADYGDAKSVGDGLFEVPVTAVVKKGRLNQELKAVGIATGAVKGDSLAAELFSGKERVANAEKFFAERFKDFPQNVMEGVMLTKTDGSPDIEVDTDSGHIFANVAFRVNQENYAKWTQALMELLQAIASQTDEYNLSFKNNIHGILEAEGVKDAIVIATPKKPERTTWPVSVYRLDESIWDALGKALEATAPHHGFIEVILKDEDNSPICSGRANAETVVGAITSELFQNGCWNSSAIRSRNDSFIAAIPIAGDTKGWCRRLYIAPWILGFSDSGLDRVYRHKEGIVRRHVDLGEVSEDDLAAVTGYEVKVEFTKH